MRFGLALPHYDFSFPDGGPVSHERVAAFARDAERLGFHSAWISDHFFLSLERYGAEDAPLGALEPLTTLGALAAVTERIRLGTLVLSAPFRHPGIVAKMATAADLFSNGRFDLGVGAGWYEREFAGFGYEFGDVTQRFSLLEEALRALDALFGEGPVDLEGRFVRLRGAYNRPRPTQQPRPPVWLGSKGGARSLRLAARYADGWNTVWRWSASDYATAVERAARACEEEGRDPSTLRLSVGLYTLVGRDDSDVANRFRALQRWAPGGALRDETVESFRDGALVGTIGQVVDTVGAFGALGVEEIILSPASLPFALFDPSMLELFASEVLPRAVDL